MGWQFVSLDDHPFKSRSSARIHAGTHTRSLANTHSRLESREITFLSNKIHVLNLFENITHARVAPVCEYGGREANCGSGEDAQSGLYIGAAAVAGCRRVSCQMNNVRDAPFEHCAAPRLYGIRMEYIANKPGRNLRMCVFCVCVRVCVCYWHSGRLIRFQ